MYAGALFEQEDIDLGLNKNHLADSDEDDDDFGLFSRKPTKHKQ